MNPLPTPSESRVVTYRRVSSAEQRNGRGDREAFGVDAQGAAIRAFVEREGLEVAADFTEDVSGTLPLDQRPELQAALSTALRLGAGAVVVARRDRLARDEWAAYDALRTMRAAGQRVLYADGSNADDESGLLLDGISHVIAAHERRVIVARLRAGREAKASRHPGAQAQGGKAPYGYRRVKGAPWIAVEPREAETVRRIFALVREGQSLKRVAETLSAENGRRWHPTAIRRIVGREVYKRESPGRIVDPRMFNAAQRELAKRRRG